MMLINKTCLVTGGTAGIGLAIVQRFLGEGADVHFIGRNYERGKAVEYELLEMHPSRKVRYHQADVASTHDIKLLEGSFTGPLHVLVNNAAVMDNRLSVLELEESDWERVIRTNLTSVFLVSKHFVPHIIRAGGGCVINLASRAGIIGRPLSPAYCAAKAGVINLTRQMALDFAPNGIRVNCISPGKISTPGVQQVVQREEALQINDVISHHPLEKIGDSASVAWAALFLASDESGMANGMNLILDAGTTACM